ncbi:sugar transferase [Candidatus Uhrbacteria bacterium]|nr:sugar transferase [Candidatus Uhrbacteria bacterium]
MRRLDLFFTTILVPLDYAALLLAALAAYALRHAEFAVARRPVIFNLPFELYLKAAALIALGWIIIFALSGLYTIGRRKKLEEFKKVVVASTAGLGAVLAVIVFSRELFESRFILLVSWGFAIVFVSMARIILRVVRSGLLRAGVGLQCVAVIGRGSSAQALLGMIKHNPKYGLKVVFHAETLNKDAELQLRALAARGGLDQIIALSQNGGDDLHRILDLADEYHLAFRYSADVLATHGAGLEFDTLAGVPLMEIKRTRLEGWGRVYKRIFDIIGALLLIIVTFPIMLLTALAIKLDSRGSILFQYPRVGQGGKRFQYVKFRSMKPDTHEMRYKELKHLDIRKGPLVKFKDTEDPRITAVGRLIRKWSIDELPELFLVLAGKMSLVGPRPHFPEEVAQYEKHQKKIMRINPGMTGLAQISGRADLSFDEETRLDTYYMEHWSLKLDLIILLKTPLAVAGQRGTY